MIKVMIADDQELIRQSLQIVLEMKEGIEVTATAKAKFRRYGRIFACYRLLL